MIRFRTESAARTARRDQWPGDPRTEKAAAADDAAQTATEESMATTPRVGTSPAWLE